MTTAETRLEALAANAEPTDSNHIFWATVWLFVTIVAVKGSYVAMATFWKWAKSPWDYASWLYVQWFAAAAQADAIFAFAVGVAAGLLSRLARGKDRAEWFMRHLFLGFGVLCVVYAVVSRQAFSYYSAPLTYQLLQLGGEPARLWSSIEAFVTPGAVLAALALPVTYVLLVIVGRRIDYSLRPRNRTVLQALLFAVGLIWLALGQQLVNSNWFLAQDRHFKDSPHQVFLESLFRSALNSVPTLGSSGLVAEDFSDFRPASPSRKGLAANVSWPSPPPRNVILVVLESVGTRYLSLYGSSLDTTPRLVGEQSNAIVFDRYYAPVGWTAYSLFSLVMAKYPPMERYNELSFRAATVRGSSVAKVLAEAGYRTAFMSAGDPDWASPGFLEENGFAQVLRGKDLAGAAQVSSWGTQDRFLFDAILGWIDKDENRPFFVMAWTDQTHHPYKIAEGQQVTNVLGADERKAKPSLANYASLIREADAGIGKLLDGLRRRGLAEDTIVVVTGDHGEAFGEPHGRSGHGFSVYDEEVRVPLMVWSPKLSGHAGRSGTVGSHVDLAPTIIDLLGLAHPPGWDGQSLFDTTRPGRTYMFAAAWGQYLLGLCTGELKYIYDARTGEEELYDLRSDPDELSNIAPSNSQTADRFRRRLAAWVAEEQRRRAERRMVARQ